MLESPFSAGSALMRPNDGAVDHLDGSPDALGLVQGFHQHLPQFGERSAPELPVGRGPFTETLMQIPPLRAGAGKPENPTQNKNGDPSAVAHYAPRGP